MKQSMICIVCPKGCQMEITEVDGAFEVTGNGCKRGITYGIKELTAATRTLTSTVRIVGGRFKRLPVVTKGEIPKETIFQAMAIINQVTCTAPIEMGQVIVENLLGLGINVVASRDMPKVD